MIKKTFFAFRKYFVILITIFSYILFIYSFFFKEFWLLSTVYLIIFFLFIHYFWIEIKSYGLKYFVYIIIVASFLEMLLIGFDNIFKLFSLHIINLGIIFLTFSLEKEITNAKLISSWSIFMGGLRLFSIMVALSYSLFFIAKYEKFNLTCEILYNNINSFIDTVSTPLQLSINEVNSIKGSFSDFYDTSVKDLLGISSKTGALDNSIKAKLTGSNIDLNTALSGDNSQIINFLKDKYNIKNLDSLKSMSGQNINMSGINNYTTSGGLINKIDSFKKSLIDQVLKDKKTVDSKICSFMIDEIEKRYNNPSFKFSVVLLLFLVLWPFIRIVLTIVSILNLIFFKIINILGVYKFETVTDEVDEIN